MAVKGFPYPVLPNPRGYFFSDTGTNVLKADLLQLLLTNPNERVMLPEYGTPLRRLFFEPADSLLADEARQMIVQSITRWEPRIAVTALNVSVDPEAGVLKIQIQFTDPENIKEVDNLTLELPVGGGAN
jgi:phage baseplate assembly protein W